MYYSFSEKLFYFLSISILLLGGFVFESSSKQEVASFQSEVRGQLAVAVVEVFGDQPIFGDVELVLSGINEFYNQAAIETIALLSQPQTDEDLIRVADQVVALVKNTINQEPVVSSQPELAFGENFMSEEPIYNLVPDNFEYEVVVAEPQQEALDLPTARVAGISIIEETVYEDESPVNAQQPWVTMRDNHTGQMYCVAIYNGEVNKYLGGCKYDYE